MAQVSKKPELRSWNKVEADSYVSAHHRSGDAVASSRSTFHTTADLPQALQFAV
jgi:hypothetical protein